MNRSLFRLVQEQVYVTNNRVFDMELALELRRLGYSSHYWISQSYCHALNSLPKVSEYRKGHQISNAREWVYNADQMPDGVKIDSLCASTTPRMAISGKPICGKYANSFSSIKNFSLNHWIRKEVLDSLGIHIISGATGVNIEFGNRESIQTITLYNIDEIEESHVLKTVLEPTYISAMLGERFDVAMTIPLIRASMLNQYQSQVWVAKEYLGHLGVSAKNGETPTTVTQNSLSPLKYTEYPRILCFNAEQTDDPVKVIEYVSKMQTVPLCASTGKRYSHETELYLIELQRQCSEFSRYWLDVRQACSLGLSIASETGFPVKITGKETILYNSSQTNQPLTCFLAARNYRHLYKLSNRDEILARPFDRW